MNEVRVLYIEDDDSQRGFFARGLRSKGFKVTVARTGHIGLRLFEVRTFDVILCDLNMPGLNGMEVMERVRRKDWEIPFIILTAHGTVSLAVNALKKGADHFILKPADISEIVIAIQQVLEKRALERELHSSESSLHMLMQNVPDIIYSLNRRGDFVSLSPAVEHVMGYMPSELVGTSVFKIIHPDDRDRVRTGFMEAAKSGKEQIRTLEFRMVTKTGEVKHFEVRGRTVVQNGRVEKSDGIARDISQRKYLEEELRRYSLGLEEKAKELERKTYLLGKANVDLLSIQEQLEEKNAQMESLLKELAKSRDELQTILDANPNVILSVSPEKTITAVNRSVEDFFGIKATDVLGMEFDTFMEQIRGCFEDFDLLLKMAKRLHAGSAQPSHRELDPAKLYELSVNQIRPKPRIVVPLNMSVLDDTKAELARIWFFYDITALKRADEQLRAIVNASPIPLIVTRLSDGKILFVNDHLAELLGFDAKELMGRTTPDFYYNPAERQTILEKLKRDKHVHNHEVLIKRQDGTAFWVILSAELTQIGEESVAISGLYDINERKRAEEALERERNFVSATLDTASALVIVLDPQGRIVRFNRACEQVSGYSFKEMQGRQLWDVLLVPEEEERIRGVFAELCAGQFPNTAENYWISKAGERRLISWSNTVLVDGEGTVEYVIGTGIDITEHRAMEEALQLSERNYRELVENSNSIILRWDNNGIITFFNEFAQRFFGYSEEDILGRNVVGTIVPEIDSSGSDLTVMMKDIEQHPEKYVSNENENMKRDGERVWITWANKPVFDDAGNVKEILSIGKDVTDRRKAVDELTHAHTIYRQAIENAEGVPYLKDYVEDKYEFIGEGVKNLLNISADDLTPKRMSELTKETYVTDPEVSANPTEYGKAFMRGEVNRYRVDLRIETPAGEEKWLSDCSVPLRDEQSGKITGSLGILQDITQRKQTENSLRLYREIFLDSNDGIAIYDKDGKIIEQNPAHRQYTGYSDREILGMTQDELFGAEKANLIQQDVAKVGKYRGEVQTFSKKGAAIDTDLSISSVIDDVGNLICYAGIGRDITERKRTEKVITTRLRYEEGLAACSQALLVGAEAKDAMTKALASLLKASGASRVYIFENYQYKGHGLCMRQTHEVCADGVRPHADDFPLHDAPYKQGFQRWRRLLAKGEPVRGAIDSFPAAERQLLGASGTLSTLLIPITVNEDWHGFLGFDDVREARKWSKEDIRSLRTASEMIGAYLESKQFEETLRVSEERFRSLVENARDIIYSLTPTGEFTYISPQITELIGYTVRDLLGKPFFPLLHPDDFQGTVDWFQSRLKSTWRPGSYEFRLIDRDGNIRWLAANSSIIQDEHGNVMEVVGVVRDITELRKILEDLEKANRHLRETQAQLVQSEKMASLGMLVAGIAHEINTPIGAVHSMHNTLLRTMDRLRADLDMICAADHDIDQRIRKNLKIIEDANNVIQNGTERVTTIVRRLRSFARLDESDLQKTDIHEGIEDTLTLIHHEIKHNITVVKDYGDIPQIACYPGKLNQVFLNVLINAKQAIKDKGTISITTRVHDDKVHIAIADDGVGIPKENLEKVFDPGFTTKGVRVGTGLGLSICYQIIQEHHGDIKVESELGRGSTFTIILPRNLHRVLHEERQRV